MCDNICSWFIDSNEARGLNSAVDSLPQFMGPQHMCGFAGELDFFYESVDGVFRTTILNISRMLQRGFSF
uniref:Uncharacterized protein n=1 Tax=Medicago truncatula TaxID=3880 RepID=Q2HVC3_MEDTR|nr:hypothetical protein MtrDRAFT_AC148965g25v2 [Medicago truncatula]